MPNLPKDLITPRNKRFFHFMAHFFESLTGFPDYDLIPLFEERITVIEIDETIGRIVCKKHTFVRFPFVCKVAQAYDITDDKALHLKYRRGLPLFPAYIPSQELSAVGPFAPGWKFAVALTKKDGCPVKITPKGEILERIPRSWIPSQFLN